MLRDLKPQSYLFSYGAAQLHIRFDMAALLSLENVGYQYTDILSDKITGKAIADFFHAGLVENVGAEREQDIFKTYGAEKLWSELRAAMIEALPAPDPLVIPTPAQGDGKIDFEMLFTLAVDVMHKDDNFFWGSTLRELLPRWQRYAVAKGYAKAPEKIEMYDTEGM